VLRVLDDLSVHCVRLNRVVLACVRACQITQLPRAPARPRSHAVGEPARDNCDHRTDGSVESLLLRPRERKYCNAHVCMCVCPLSVCPSVREHLYILNTLRATSVTVGVASSVANDVIMRTGAASAVSARRQSRHSENDVAMTIAGLWRYDDWRHVATGFIAI